MFPIKISPFKSLYGSFRQDDVHRHQHHQKEEQQHQLKNKQSLGGFAKLPLPQESGNEGKGRAHAQSPEGGNGTCQEQQEVLGGFRKG